MKTHLFLFFAFLFSTNLLTAQYGIEWEQNYQGSSFGVFGKILPTDDGGFLLGSDWFEVRKIDEMGNTEWEQSYGDLPVQNIITI